MVFSYSKSCCSNAAQLRRGAHLVAKLGGQPRVGHDLDPGLVCKRLTQHLQPFFNGKRAFLVLCGPRPQHLVKQVEPAEHHVFVSTCDRVKGSRKYARRIQSKVNKLKWTWPYFRVRTWPSSWERSTRSPCSSTNHPPAAKMPDERTAEGKSVNLGKSYGGSANTNQIGSVVWKGNPTHRHTPRASRRCPTSTLGRWRSGTLGVCSTAVTDAAPRLKTPRTPCPYRRTSPTRGPRQNRPGRHQIEQTLTAKVRRRTPLNPSIQAHVAHAMLRL